MTQRIFKVVHRVVENKPHDIDSHLIRRERAPFWLKRLSSSDYFSILIGAGTIGNPGTSDFLVGAFKPGQFVVATLSAQQLNQRLFSGESLSLDDWVLQANESSQTMLAIRGNITDVQIARQTSPNRLRNPQQHESVITFSWADQHDFRTALHRLVADFMDRDIVQPEWWHNEKLFLLSGFDKEAFVDHALALRGVPYLAGV